MLLCSLSSVEQLAALDCPYGLGWGWSLAELVTMVDGIGSGIAPALIEAFDGRIYDKEIREALLDVLARLPTDEAFRLMVRRLDLRGVQPAVAEAAERFPVRAARLLAQATGSASGEPKKNGRAQAAAQAALAAIAAEHGAAEVQQAAWHYGEDAASAVAALLAIVPWRASPPSRSTPNGRILVRCLK